MVQDVLRLVDVDQVSERRLNPVDEATVEQARTIVQDICDRGELAVRHHAERLGDLDPGEPLLIGREELDKALKRLSSADRGVLQRTADRIKHFAEAQRAAIHPVDVICEGVGRMGHRISPLLSAGCYAPGGRYPLPSSVLMTAVTARAAGVQHVWVASPKPHDVTLAAAALAEVDGLLAVGGAQAIAAFAYGMGSLRPCDAIVGPGNRWVTAAKQLFAGRLRIDMLAGPSELVVLADGSADPSTVAADLLAQAEHDVDAVPILVSLSASLVDHVQAELKVQLAELPTAPTARHALKNGFCVHVQSLEQAISVCNRLAPEHLQVLLQSHDDMVDQLRTAGALFIGNNAAEVFGDYGAGPNHTLPTGGTARCYGGLSVLNFLRVSTYLTHSSDARAEPSFIADCASLARLEGLEAHARAAERRRD